MPPIDRAIAGNITSEKCDEDDVQRQSADKAPGQQPMRQAPVAMGLAEHRIGANQLALGTAQALVGERAERGG